MNITNFRFIKKVIMALFLLCELSLGQDLILGPKNQSVNSYFQTNLYSDIKQTRRLSIERDWETNTILRTKNGIIPIVPCPIGSYRIIKNSKLNNRSDGCILCPRGRYGSTIGLTSSLCSGPCPRGKFGDYKGASSPNDCSPCPFDSYGPSEGSTNPSCVKCPVGTYNPNLGSSTFASCIKCPPNYFGNQCSDQLDFQEIIDISNYKADNPNKKLQSDYQTSSQISSNSKSKTYSQPKNYQGCGGFNNVCKTQHLVSLM